MTSTAGAPGSGALRFGGWRIDPGEHQLEPFDRVRATYLVGNPSDWVEIIDVRLTHVDRLDNAGKVVLRCEPAVVTLDGPLKPHEERQVTVELITDGHLPGRHPLRVQAAFDCRPVSPTAEAVFEFTVTPD